MPRACTRHRLFLESLEVREVPAGLVLDDLGPVAATSGFQGGTATIPPSVAIDGNGSRFVVAWTDLASPSTVHVRARVLAADGSPLTGVLTVTNAPLPYNATRPVKVDVGIDDQGRFAVAYDGLPSPILADIGLQRFNADGSRVGSTHRVGFSVRLEINPTVDLAADGRIVVGFDQATGNLATHRLNSLLYASFDNLGSNSSASISSSGGEIHPKAVFNGEGKFLLSGTTLTTQAVTPLRVFSANGSISASTVVRADVLQPPALADVRGGNEWRLVYLDRVGGQASLMMRTVKAGASSFSPPVVGAPVLLLSGVSADAPPSAAVDGQGNLAVSYLRGSGANKELVVSFFTSSGGLVQTLAVAGLSGAARHGVGLGATAQGSMAVHAAQSGPATGSKVPFQVRAALFTVPPAPTVATLPPVELAAAPDMRFLAVALEQMARTSSSALPLAPDAVDAPVPTDLVFGRPELVKMMGGPGRRIETPADETIPDGEFFFFPEEDEEGGKDGPDEEGEGYASTTSCAWACAES